jgi:hypothetical protein
MIKENLNNILSSLQTQKILRIHLKITFIDID